MQKDYIRMLATVINSITLQNALEKKNIRSRLLGGIVIDPVCERMSAGKTVEYMESGFVVIISGGTGNPFFFRIRRLR